MDANRAEILAGAAGAGAFIIGLLVLHLPIWLCLTTTALIYAGLNLLMGGIFQAKVQQIVGSSATAIAQLTDQILKNRQQLDHLRRRSASLPHKGIRERVLRVCDLSEKIFNNFEEDPDDIRRAHRFLSQFNRVLPIIEDYLHLASDTDRRKVLTVEDEQNIDLTLKAFEENLQLIYQGFQENNLHKLRMATGTLKRMLEMERTIQPSDRKPS